MKNVNISCLLAVLCFLAAPAISDGANIVGIFEGIIETDGNLEPGNTTFDVSANQKITGSYVFGSEGNRETGILRKCKLRGQRLNCRWSDAYGSGRLRVKFSQSFCDFKGTWSISDQPSTKYKWTGSNKECSAATR